MSLIDKLKMLGYKIVVDTEEVIIAMAKDRGFISTSKEKQYHFSFDRAGFSKSNERHRITAVSGRSTDIIYVDSYGNIIELLGTEYDTIREDYFYEDKQHWLFRKNDGSILYMDKELGTKAVLKKSKDTLSDRHTLSLIGVAPMCIVLNSVYINFKTGQTQKVIGDCNKHTDYTTVEIHSNRDSLVTYWIDNKTGRIYRTFNDNQPVIDGYKVNFTGKEVGTSEKVCMTYELRG